MRRNSRLHYAYLNCSVLPCGQIIDAFCLDVTKCGERLCNETNIENAPLRLVQHRCLDWQKAWTEISSGGGKRTDGLLQTNCRKTKSKSSWNKQHVDSETRIEDKDGQTGSTKTKKGCMLISNGSTQSNIPTEIIQLWHQTTARSEL